MITIDQDPDYVPPREIRWSAIVIVAGIVISIVATVVLIGGHVGDVLSITTKHPARVEQTLFRATTDAERLRAEADRRLESYGWVDRTGDVIHVPLEVAIEHYLGGAR